MSTAIELSYIASAVLFIIGLKMLSHADTAVRGNTISALGMLVAVVATLADQHIVTYQWIAAGVLIGGAIGAVAAARVPMTSMPEFVAIFNGTGGLASLLVGWADYHANAGRYGEMGENVTVVTIATFLAVVIGGVTFTGSMLAYAKLAEKIGGKPILFKGQQWVNGGVLLAFLATGAIYVLNPDSPAAAVAFFTALALSFVFGILATIPIGGADMPVVISLLNSYSGLAACAAGFVIENTVLIVAGSLVGASGIILTSIMCKAMNRSLAHVLFSGFGSATVGEGAEGTQGEVKALSADDAYYILEAAHSVVIVPGYGMAVAQAQHVVRELADILESRGVEVKYAIHPVAGRMPGHMNVLLAEADVPYEQLVEMADINPVMPTVDVCIVIGANDVVNPAAREDATSPIYGMPIINADLARTVFVLKRSMASGFAGIQNPLFFKENTRMLFGDAKTMVSKIVTAFKEA